MKVLFIDDEPLIRKGLQVIIPWSEYGFTAILEAEDGLEGLNIILAENPELVLLDIHMENMSGLSLAKKARENDYTGKIIILTGYSQFEYAKSAIDYGVTSYLLKPVDPALLVEAVQKSIDELQKEMLVSIYANQPANLAKNSILLNILNGSISYTDEIETVYHIKLNSNYYRLASLFTTEDTIENVRKREFLTQLQKKYLSVSVSNTLVLFLTSPSQEQALKKQLQSYWDNIQDSSIIAIISSKSDSHANLANLYKENQLIYENIYYYKKRQSNLITADSLQQHFTMDLADFNLITWTENLYKQILLLQNEEVENSTLSLLDYFIQRKPPRDSIGFILINCYTQITSKLSQNYPKLEFEIADKEKFTSRLYADQYLCDNIAYLNSQFQKAIAYIKVTTQGSPCERICKYIDENLASPLKLETIARIFGYNPAYLGKLFFKEVGEHFNSYLDKRRIDLAKEYLQKGITISQACDLSGFTNTDYFTKKFKKYVGILPSEYKKLKL